MRHHHPSYCTLIAACLCVAYLRSGLAERVLLQHSTANTVYRICGAGQGPADAKGGLRPCVKHGRVDTGFSSTPASYEPSRRLMQIDSSPSVPASETSTGSQPMATSNITFTMIMQHTRLSPSNAALQQRLASQVSQDVTAYFSAASDQLQLLALTQVQVSRNSTAQVQVAVTASWPDSGDAVPRQLLQLINSMQQDPTVALSPSLLNMFLPPSPVVTLDAPVVSDPALQGMLVFSQDSSGTSTGSKLSIGLATGLPFLLILIWHIFRTMRRKCTGSKEVCMCDCCCPDDPHTPDCRPDAVMVIDNPLVVVSDKLPTTSPPAADKLSRFASGNLKNLPTCATQV